MTKAFNEALHIAQSMPGWAIIATDADTGHIEASQQSRWFRFTDDIVIRVSTEVAGSDYGVNAARIRAYFDALRNASTERRNLHCRKLGGGAGLDLRDNLRISAASEAQIE
jgi:uncharacterized protein (DUF1499 family)